MNKDYQSFPSGDDGIEARLWDYIDGIDSATEKAAIEKLITENAIWRVKYQELLELHQLVQSSELEEPSMRFTKNVIEEIGKFHIAPAAKAYINKKVIWGIGSFFITMIIGFLIYAIAQVNWSEGSTGNAIGIDITKIDFSKMFNNSLMNVFMMLNVILGLIFFDRYLANKKNKLAEKP
jgi:hypothetical protein